MSFQCTEVRETGLTYAILNSYDKVANFAKGKHAAKLCLDVNFVQVCCFSTIWQKLLIN